MNDDTQPTTQWNIQSPPPSTLVDPFAHYEDRRKILLRTFARLISNSEVQTFKRCRRKWWLAWYRGLRLTREKPTGPRAVGDRVHRALAYWYVPAGEPRTDPRDALERLIADDIRQILQAHEDLDEEARANLVKELNRDADLERAMIAGYTQWLEETGQDAHLTILGSEMYQDAKIPGLTGRNGVAVYAIAKMDARVRRETDMVILFIDHKTVADFASKVMTLPMDEQMLWYDLIETLNGVPLGDRSAGALFNMLRRVKRTVKAKPPFFQRLEVRHNVHELRSFYERLWGTMSEILRSEARLDNGESDKVVAYPTPSPNCTWDCDFFLLCPRFDDGSRVEAMIDNMYTAGDPLAYYQR